MHIFCDMDGVLADFTLGAAWVVGKVPPNKPMDFKCSNNVDSLFGPTTWARIVSEGERFWDELHTYPWTKDLWDLILEKSNGNAYILSDPGQRGLIASSGPAKHRWCKRHLGIEPDRIILTGGKAAVARKDAVLIDDKDSNIHEWSEAGGRGILFPQYWNDNFRLVHGGQMTFVRQELAKIMFGD